MADEGIPPLITLEEHFFTSAISEPPKYGEMYKHIPGVAKKMYDIDDLRISEMDAGAVSLQVISHGPGLAEEGVEVCRAANNQLAGAVKRHTERFAGFAVLPMGDAAAAASELRRCVEQLGFVGALVDNHFRGGYYEGGAYDVFWAEAERLDVPVYLHPTWPTEAMAAAHASDAYPAGAADSMATSGFGWHGDVHKHVLRLYAAQVFDRHPRLKIVAGHFGEMLPFMMGRVNRLSKRWQQGARTFDDVYRQNIYITTSGVWSVDPLACILRNTPADHILYSVDYPFSDNRVGLDWVKELKASGLVDQETFEMICYKNAEKLLGVKAPRR